MQSTEHRYLNFRDISTIVCIPRMMIFVIFLACSSEINILRVSCVGFQMKKREHDLAVAKRKMEKADKAAAAAVQQAAIAAAKEKVRNALSSRQAEKALR